MFSLGSHSQTTCYNKLLTGVPRIIFRLPCGQPESSLNIPLVANMFAASLPEVTDMGEEGFCYVSYVVSCPLADSGDEVCGTFIIYAKVDEINVLSSEC